MAINGRQLERIQYWQGQMLRAGDFRAQQQTDEQLRWWHNRSIHGAYGVRFGLTVHEVEDAHVPTLEVDCGLAYDCSGHEIILPMAQQVPIPALSQDDKRARILLIRYNPGRDARSCCEGAVEPCWPGSASRFSANVDFLWKPEDQVRIADGVPLTRIEFSASGAALDLLRPPIARPLARERLASGDTIPGNTPWEVWYEDFTAHNGTVRQVAVGIQTRIDTTAAGFTSVPCYFAQLMGPLWDRNTSVFVPAFFANIADAAATGFTFRLLMRGIPQKSVELQARTSDRVITAQSASKESGTAKRRDIAVPERVQQVVSVVEAAELRPGDQLLITAPEGEPETEPISALVAGFDFEKKLAILDFGAIDSRPELADKFSAVTVFNPGFDSFFTSFARKQKLHVCWLGCEGMMESPKGCPGLIPVSQPCDQSRN